MIPSFTNELANKNTVRDLIKIWDESVAEIRQAVDLLREAEARLQANFSKVYSINSIINHGYGADIMDIERTISTAEGRAWESIVDRMEIRPLLSIERAKELDNNLYNRAMPPLTEENVMSEIQSAYANIGALRKEAVVEVFDILRPSTKQPSAKKYKTNTEFDIGKKVILRYLVQERYCGGGFNIVNQHINHVASADSKLRAIDNVFCWLDGQGTIKTHFGPLADAINATDASGIGETEYFKFKACKNGNLHLEFKRMDLVAELNRVAGGNRLYQGEA